MHKRGFTLIELLIVIVIIGLLTTVATTSFLSAQRNARDDARKTNVQAIAAALEAYKLGSANHIYPGKVDTSDVTSGSPCAANSTYYFNPNLDQAIGCVPAIGFSSDLFKPIPLWIPGLGQYLNPIPLETKYLDAGGGTSGSGSFDANGAPTGATRTLSYKKTATGYQVNALLERTGAGTYSVSK